MKFTPNSCLVFIDEYTICVCVLLQGTLQSVKRIVVIMVVPVTKSMETLSAVHVLLVMVAAHVISHSVMICV